MAVALLIGLWINDEYSFDHYFKKHSRLALIVSTQTWNDETTTFENIPVPLAEVLRTKYAGDLKKVVLISGAEDHTLSNGDVKFSGYGSWVQPEFPEMFTFKMITGNRNALSDPSSILLSKSVTKALFGDKDPMNETILIDKKLQLKVGGVYEDLPANTRFYGINILLPWYNQENIWQHETSWSNYHFQGFVELSDHAGFAQTSSKIKLASLPYNNSNSKEKLMLQPLDRAHLYNEYKNGKVAGGRIQLIWLFGIIGIFILLLACINFMNLSTARSEKRAREVGVRKTMGSSRQHIVGQFFCESLLISFVALVLTIPLLSLALPFFNNLAGKQIAIQWSNPFFWLTMLCFTFFTGLMAGSYPAFYLSRFKPVEVLKGTFIAGKNSSLPRKILVVFQFSVSISLIIGTITVFRQIQFARSRAVGYNQQGLITIALTEPEILKHYDAIKNDILQTGAATNLAGSSSPLTNIKNEIVSFDWKGRNPKSAPLIGLIAVTHDFGQTVRWKLKKGRDFSRNFAMDSSSGGAFILNEAAAKLIGETLPVGKILKMADKDHVIVGVAGDMLMNSPYTSPKPVVFWLNYTWRINYLTMRLNPDQPIMESLKKVQSIYKKYSLNSSFSYEFVDDQYKYKFFDEQRIGRLSTFFAILAIFISCLGLFGVASFVAGQRTKEIGVRKVLGASTLQIWQLLSKEFVILSVIAFVVAAPITFCLLVEWLRKYEYRTPISWWMFALPGFGMLLITVLTVSHQSIKVALTNPVKSLRQE
jgi:ABC-type antimicrobial peptide transport system permease subunit